MSAVRLDRTQKRRPRAAWLRWCLALSLPLCLALGLAGRAWAQDAPLDPVVKTGILKVAVYKDFYPFSDVKDGGIDEDFAAALAQKLGAKLSLLPFDAGETLNDDLRNMVWKGHYLGYGPADVMLHVPIDAVLARQNENVAFLGAYHVESVMLSIDTRRIPDWDGFEVFSKEKIAVDGASFSAQIMLGMDGGHYREQIVNSRRIQDAIEELRAGRVAAVMATRSELEAAGLNKAPYHLVDVSLPGAPRRSWAVGMGVKADRKELAGRLAAALKDLQDSGALAKIYAQHGVRYIQP
jgi:ABC-type amino acid transport substrate-binding protein